MAVVVLVGRPCPACGHRRIAPTDTATRIVTVTARKRAA